MSEKYPGGLITKTPVTPTGPYQTGAASGVWTLDQQLQYQKQGIWPTAGLTPNYIEDVFSTYLYTGNGSTQTITNGIDLSTYGGLVWNKNRSYSGGTNHWQSDSARGKGGSYYKPLFSNTTDAQVSSPAYGLTSFNTNGFSLSSSAYVLNFSGETYASWTFRKQPKFFDIVTYTGNGSNRTIAHSLGSIPGCIFVKRTDTTGNWQVYHNSLTSAAYSIQLNLTSAQASAPTVWNSTAPTSSVFSVGTDASVNASGGTYVAYIFAHNAGGFGNAGTDNVITCGSFTTDASGNGSVNLGYEPQWVLIKEADGVADWWLMDNMRGFSPTKGITKLLIPSSSSAEVTSSATFYSAYPTATGFVTDPYLTNANKNVIYIAIRRGPMKTPTLGTSVFSPTYLAGDNGTSRAVSAGFAPDLFVFKRVTTGDPAAWADKLRGPSIQLNSTSTAAEVNQSSAGTAALQSFSNTGIVVTNAGTNINTNATGFSYGYYSFQRAPGFFDEVCYTGTGSATTQAHNLGVAPELIIVKERSANSTTGWLVGATTLGYGNKLYLNLTNTSAADSTAWNSTAPTSSVFSVGTNADCNTSAATYVAYLFASCPGVSKIGSYTGTGASQVINCGFTSGARFVMIKRTDTTGDWYVWDTARGMVSGTDNYFLINLTDAQTNANYVFTSSTGFTIQAAAPAAINASGGTYIFLAIA